MPKRTYTPTGVTFARENKPKAEGTVIARDRFKVRGGSGNRARGFLRFNPDVPDRMQPVSWELQVDAETALSPAVELTAQGSAAFTKSLAELNWSNMPATTGPSDSDTAGAQWRFDVTDIVGAGGSPVLFRIFTTADLNVWLHGKRVKNGAPRLVAVLEPRPIQPVDVAPNGVHSVAAPYFTWHGQVDVIAVQLQIGAVDAAWAIDTGFTAPTWDSGEVTTDESGLDTAAEGWTGVSYGTAYSVTVRERTPSGWGDWSEPIEPSREEKLDFDILNPGATDADATYPVTWDVTSGTQTAWQVLITSPGLRRPVDTGVVPGDDSGWNGIRKGLQLEAGMVFTTTVRLWGDTDHVGSPGDPVYREKSVTTTYQPTDTVAPLTWLSAVQDLNLPWPVLHVGRSPLPDQARILRAGEQLVLLDVAEDGTTYADVTCPPNTDVVYSGIAVVNGEDSDTVLTTSVRTRVEGIYVIEPTSGRGFCLSGVDGLAITLGVNVIVHTPAAGAHLIRQTLALRGPEGSISGRIDDWPGRTLEQQKADADWLREHPEKPVQILMADLNVRAAVTNLVPLFDPAVSFYDQIRHGVTLDFSDAPEDDE